MMINFQDRYCQKFNCSKADFAFHVLWKIMCPEGVPFARLIGLFDRKFFTTDLNIVRQLGVSVSLQEIAQLANDLRNDYRQESQFLRATLRVRISGKRMLKLGKEVLPEADVLKSGQDVSERQKA